MTSLRHDGVPYPAFDGSQACYGKNTELFFPHRSRPIPEPARAACASCPFQRACLAYALTHNVEGVWGGTTEVQREQLRTAHGLTATSLHDELDAATRRHLERTTEQPEHDPAATTGRPA